jgi:ribose 5-phosphate isomerase A
VVEQEERKHEAALRALDFVRDGMTLGLGSGSTAAHAIRALGERVRAGLRVRGVPTSRRSGELARAAGIPLVSLDQVDRLDLTIDGADEIQVATFHVVKGKGGALLREKLVACASDLEILAVDETKLVDRLGEHDPLPVEVVPFGWRLVRRALADLGGVPVLRSTDPAAPGSAPFVTDNANYILDCRFPPVDDPPALERAIKAITGVVESGLFIGLVDRVVVAGADGVRVLEPPSHAWGG